MTTATRYRTLLSLLLLLPSVTLAADNSINTKRGLGIQGYDPVAYFDSGAIKGDKNLIYDFQGVIYHFSQETNREKFVKDPEQYLPQYGGYCAYAMLEGDKVSINPKSYKIVEDKLYLFYDGLFGDTLQKWNELTSDQVESSLLSTANLHWEALTQ